MCIEVAEKEIVVSKKHRNELHKETFIGEEALFHVYLLETTFATLCTLCFFIIYIGQRSRLF